MTIQFDDAVIRQQIRAVADATSTSDLACRFTDLYDEINALDRHGKISDQQWAEYHEALAASRLAGWWNLEIDQQNAQAVQAAH